MEKIKASEILKTNPQLDMSQLKLYRFFAVDEDFDMTIFKESPIRIDDGIYGGSWKPKDDYYLCINGTCSGWEKSLREIDFSEYEPSQEAKPQHDFYPLFLHLSQEHGLTLTDEQLYEIVLLAKKIKLPHEENI
jgi:hypothetical protein